MESLKNVQCVSGASGSGGRKRSRLSLNRPNESLPAAITTTAALFSIFRGSQEDGVGGVEATATAPTAPMVVDAPAVNVPATPMENVYAVDAPATSIPMDFMDELNYPVATITSSQLPNPEFMELLGDLDLGNMEEPATETPNDVANLVKGVCQQGESSVNISAYVPVSLPAITNTVHYEEDTSVPSTSILKEMLEQQKSLPAPVSPIPDSQTKNVYKGKSPKNGKRQVKKSGARKPLENAASVRTGSVSAMLPKRRRPVRKSTPAVNHNKSDSESEFFQRGERAGPSNAVLPRGVRSSSPAVNKSDSESDELAQRRKKLFNPFYEFYMELKREIAADEASMRDDAKARKSALAMIQRGKEILRNIDKRHTKYERKVKEVREMQDLLKLRD